MRRRTLAALTAAAAVALLWAGNRPWKPRPPGHPRLLAHRGLGQDFDRTDLQGDTCTAARMTPPRHGYLEDTIPGIAAAFALGADRVEIDVHPTTDGQFVVFHDWTVDCRTDGHGVTREHTLAELQRLDIGWGYTADGGRTFPFRGRGDRMPSLAEVLTTFPRGRFLVNVKSADAAEGALLADAVGDPGDRVAFSGDEAPMAVLRARGARTLSKPALKRCVLGYVALGWTGHVPDACRHSVVYVPINVAPWLWGWDRVLVDRFAAADAELYVLGAWSGGWSTGLDDPADRARLPAGFRGGVVTDRVDEWGAIYD